jgi:hypothetical protein
MGDEVHGFVGAFAMALYFSNFQQKLELEKKATSCSCRGSLWRTLSSFV